MMRYELTREVAAKIVAYVRSGGQFWAACEASGIPRAVGQEWLRRGRIEEREPFWSFDRDVKKAQGEGQLSAEISLHSKNSLAWLRYGPGREPGKGTSLGPAKGSRKRKGVMGPAEQRLIEGLIEALEPYDEARAAVVAFLDREELREAAW